MMVRERSLHFILNIPGFVHVCSSYTFLGLTKLSSCKLDVYSWDLASYVAVYAMVMPERVHVQINWELVACYVAMPRWCWRENETMMSIRFGLLCCHDYNYTYVHILICELSLRCIIITVVLCLVYTAPDQCFMWGEEAETWAASFSIFSPGTGHFTPGTDPQEQGVEKGADTIYVYAFWYCSLRCKS